MEATLGNFIFLSSEHYFLKNSSQNKDDFQSSLTQSLNFYCDKIL